MGLMLRRRLSDLDQATGGALRRALGRGPAVAPPGGRTVSLAAGEQPSGLLACELLHPARTVTPDDERLCAFLRRQTAVAHTDCSFQTEPVFRATLAGATFDPHSGAVWAGDGALLLDSIKNAGRLKHVAAAHVAPGVLPGLHSSIAGPIGGNTFHWLIESLPRLHSLAGLPEPITLLMPDDLNAFQRESLSGCLPPNVTLRFVSRRARLRVERFVLPSFLTTQWDFAYPPRAYLAYVRDRLYDACGLPPEPARRERVYISRARARVRRVLNEEAVLAALRPLGFRRYYLEELSFAEQVRLFHDAELVVAPHGAGLANLLFAGPIPVVEFISRVVTPVYFFLALALGQTYRYVYPDELGEGERPLSPADGRRYSQARDLDLTIDLDALRAALDGLC